MKKNGLILCFVLLAAACSSTPKNRASIKNDDSKTSMVAEAKVKTPTNPNAKVDAVCGMPEGKYPYTEFTVYKGDTMWFCSPHCKKQFLKNPAKYVKN